jgi:hypothetical protein
MRVIQMPHTARSSLGQIRGFGFVAILLAATSSLSHPAAGQGCPSVNGRAPIGGVPQDATVLRRKPSASVHR